MLRWIMALSCAIAAAPFGCATAPHGAKTGDLSSVPTAKRLYTAGEQRFAEGRADEAVTLWRQAILQLPPEEQYDDMRHKLILRRAYGQLVAHAQTSDRHYLTDGRQMLTRYLEQPGVMVGGAGKAMQQRGEVYEILYEFESRLDALGEPPLAPSPAAGDTPPNADDPAVASANDSADDLATIGIYGARTVGADGIAATSQVARPGTRQLSRFGTARPWRAGDVRRVHVDTHDRPSVDDPATRDALRSWSTEPAPWLTQPMIEEWIPPRPYVRVGGLAMRVEGERTRLGGQGLASAVVRNVRPQLRSCYDQAFAREPDAVVQATVEFDVRADGTIARPSIVDGEVVDAVGDACVLDQLASAHVSVDRDRGDLRVRVPLTFFYDGAVYMDEQGGQGISSSIQVGLPPTQSVPTSPRGCSMQGTCVDPSAKGR